MTEIPLFPLKTVLLPGNTLELKIFEPRYLDMIATCMRENSVFGVVLIHKGEETGIDADIYSVGTTATISDWEHRADGLLGITALGVERFEILSTRTQHDGLTFAEIKLLDECNTQEIPEQFHYMLELLDHISAQEGRINATGSILLRDSLPADLPAAAGTHAQAAPARNPRMQRPRGHPARRADPSRRHPVRQTRSRQRVTGFQFRAPGLNCVAAAWRRKPS